jgi:hypothetical protein
LAGALAFVFVPVRIATSLEDGALTGWW